MMADEQQERAHLLKADKHIADSELRITEQTVRIERLRLAGQDVTCAEEVMATFQATLDQHLAHRDLILERIAQLANPSPNADQINIGEFAT